MDLEKYLPSVISLLGVMFTVAVSLWLGVTKQKADNRTFNISSDAGIRDDLIEINANLNAQLAQRDDQIKARDDRLEKKDVEIARLQSIIADQIIKITDLMLEAKQREFSIKEKDLVILQLRTELEKFNRKVYYVREIVKEDNTIIGDISNEP